MGRGLALRPAACCLLLAGWDKEAAGSSRGGQRQRGRGGGWGRDCERRLKLLESFESFERFEGNKRSFQRFVGGKGVE